MAGNFPFSLCACQSLWSGFSGFTQWFGDYILYFTFWKVFFFFWPIISSLNIWQIHHWKSLGRSSVRFLTFCANICRMYCEHIPTPRPPCPSPTSTLPSSEKNFNCPISFEGLFPPSLCVLNSKFICLGISPHGSFKSLDPTPPFHLHVSGIHCKSPSSLLIHLSSLPTATLPGPYLFPPPCRGSVFGFSSYLTCLSSCWTTFCPVYLGSALCPPKVDALNHQFLS